jgi:hypothetical protein
VARGWESKGIEAQIESAKTERGSSGRERLTAEQVSKLRARSALVLSRKRVLEDLRKARHPRHQQTLRAALAHLDEKLAELA